MNQSDSGFLADEVPLLTSSFVETKLFHETEKGYTRLFKAKRMGKWFVLKCLKKEYTENPTYQTLFQKEFEISYQLSHPHIIQTIGLEEVSPFGKCIVMEYVDGVSLREYINTHKSSCQETIRWINELCQALSYIHAKQIIHRDLKPENILITSNGRHVKLIDFGFSDTDSYAVLKEPAGTRRYAAPEQMKKGEKIDVRADIYALGIILKELGGEDKAISSVARVCCCEDITRRPSDAASVPELIKKRRLSLIIRKLLFVLALIVLLVGYYKFRTIEKVETVTEVEVTDTLHKPVVVERVIEQPETIFMSQPVSKIISDNPVIPYTMDDIMDKQQAVAEPSGTYPYRWLLKDYVDSEMDKILIPLMYRIHQASTMDELQMLLMQECGKDELFHRLQRKVYDGYASFIKSHPLTEMDAEEYRPLMEHYLSIHYEDVRQFYRPMFKHKEKDLQGLDMEDISFQERIKKVFPGLMLKHLHPYLHHCDTMQHWTSLHRITMEKWEIELKSDVMSRLLSDVSINDIYEESSHTIIESLIENVQKELHGGRIRRAEIEARFRVEK